MVAQLPSLPEITLDAQLLTQLQHQLPDFFRSFSPLFQRREQRENALLYLEGLLSDCKRKNVESLVLHLRGEQPNTIRSLQHFLSQGKWSDQPILEHLHTEVEKTLGCDDGVLIFDGCDFPKQGLHSAGVKRQRCGELGKTANCQAGVFMAYASQHGHCLLDRRLYLPEEWRIESNDKELCRECGIPEEIEFKTKQRLALEMLEKLVEKGSLQFKWVCFDEAFGHDGKFLDSLARLGVMYFAELPCTKRFWLEQPKTGIPKRKPKQGAAPRKIRLLEGEKEAEEAEKLIRQLPEEEWQRMTLKEGSKGPMVGDFVFLRVIESRNQLPGEEVWLVVRRCADSGELKYFVSNAPLETDKDELCRVSGMRWPIELCFRDGKQELGMGDYEVRSWVGWHHHMTMVILAQFLLVQMRVEYKEVMPGLTLPQARLFVEVCIPKRRRTVAWVVEVLGYRQRRNHAAYLSHRKRRILRGKHEHESVAGVAET